MFCSGQPSCTKHSEQRATASRRNLHDFKTRAKLGIDADLRMAILGPQGHPGAILTGMEWIWPPGVTRATKRQLRWRHGCIISRESFEPPVSKADGEIVNRGDPKNGNRGGAICGYGVERGAPSSRFGSPVPETDCVAVPASRSTYAVCCASTLKRPKQRHYGLRYLREPS
jgi:hypothetical protein